MNEVMNDAPSRFRYAGMLRKAPCLLSPEHDTLNAEAHDCVEAMRRKGTVGDPYWTSRYRRLRKQMKRCNFRIIAIKMECQDMDYDALWDAIEEDSYYRDIISVRHKFIGMDATTDRGFVFACILVMDR